MLRICGVEHIVRGEAALGLARVGEKLGRARFRRAYRAAANEPVMMPGRRVLTSAAASIARVARACSLPTAVARRSIAGIGNFGHPFVRFTQVPKRRSDATSSSRTQTPFSQPSASAGGSGVMREGLNIKTGVRASADKLNIS